MTTEVSKMKKEELLQYVQQLQQAAAQAQAQAQAAEQRAEQAEALAAAKAKRAPAAPKTHADLLASDPAYMAGAIWQHVHPLGLSATEEGALNALVANAYKAGKLMSAGASRQTLSRARRAVTGYLAEKRQEEAKDIVFDCLYCIPCITVTPEGDYKGYDMVLKKSPRLLAEGLQAAETKWAAASSLLAAAAAKDKAKAEKAVAEAAAAKDKAKAQLDAAAAEFASWMAKQKAAIAEGKDKAENAS